MEYLQDTYPYPAHSQPMPMYYQPLQYPGYIQQDPHLIEYYSQYPYSEYADFMHPGSMPDDYDDMGEVSSRPRLTKEQVDVLEAQFQAHPKPNSMVKRQLAMQTKLTLPRVANWFQNRRAKAKQQKKQEEFEISQTLGLQGGSGSKSLGNSPRKAPSLSYHSQSTSPVRHPSMPRSASQSPHKHMNSASQEASFASLARALEAAKAKQQRHAQELSRTMHATLPTYQQSSPQHLSMPSDTHPSFLDLRTTAGISPVPAWSSPPANNDIAGFDFGFNQADLVSAPSGSQRSGSAGSLPDASHIAYDMSSGTWQDTFDTPKLSSCMPPELASDLQTSTFDTPAYSRSRRASTTDDLASTMNTFGIAGSSPHHISDGALKPPNGDIDLAARRKRPRPSALQSSALRSRSYGALTASSPTVKTSTMPPSTHTVRHVKSLHSLDSKYAGVRKSSTSRRSPMVANFAESEAFSRLMAQQAIINAKHQSNTDASASSGIHNISPEMRINTQMPVRTKSFATELPTQYITQLPNGQRVVVSPPQTPFQQDFVPQSNTQGMMPQATGPGQFANLPEFTPPYSAGPLTNSSWSDAPLTSPELPAFTQMQYLPGSHLTPSLDLMSQYPQFVLPSDTQTEVDFGVMSDSRRNTEFFIQEFPGQKEEHAIVAKQMTNQKPKHYTFNNTAPHDFSD